MATLKQFKDYIQYKADLQLEESLIELLYENFFSNLSPSEYPRLIVLGGSPGAGKTHYRRKFLKLSDFHIHDMDEVLIKLPGYQNDSQQSGIKIGFERWWPTAQKIANAMVRFAFRHHYNVIYDRTCGTEESFLDIKAIYLAKQYHIVIYGFWVSETTALARVKERECNENRTVTPEITKEYLRRFSALWPLYTAIADEACLLDSNPGCGYSKVYHQIGGVKRVFSADNYIQFLAPGKEINFEEKFPRLRVLNQSRYFSQPQSLAQTDSEEAISNSKDVSTQLVKSKL